MLSRFSRLLLAGAVLLPAVPSLVRAADSQEWPRWRGPRGDGISHVPLADQWPEGGPKKVWEQPVGIGYSSPVALDGKIYLFSTVFADGQETLVCFDSETGKPQWSQGYPMREVNDYPGARATPFIDGQFIYTYGAGGDLSCWELASGKAAWRINIIKETGAALLGEGNHPWAEASSPLVAGDLVYVQGGKGAAIAVAVNKTTGKIVWQSEAKGVAGYAACVLGDLKDGGRELFVFGGEAIYGMDPDTGKTLWSEPWKIRYDINAATPIFDGTHLLISSGDLNGCLMLEVSKAGAKQLWRNKTEKTISAKFQAPILDGGCLYGNSEDHKGTLRCLSWADGSLKWEAKGSDLKLGAGGSIVRDDDKLITMSQDGVLSLVTATPQGCKKISQMTLFTPTKEHSADTADIWSTPTLYRGKLYAKGEDQLVCLEVGK